MRSRSKGSRKQGISSTATSAPGVRWVLFIYFGAGMSALIDEVVWVRLLQLTIGNTVYASSIVVSVFMGGLALGSLLMARHSDRVQRPLRLYAILEAGVTLSAVSFPWLLQLADTGYGWFYLAYHPSPTGLICVQVLISALIVLAPATLMGSTLPLLGRYITTLPLQLGGPVGRLYAVNMLGAALGSFLAAFVLMRVVGITATLYIAAMINLGVALGAAALSHRHERAQDGSANLAGSPVSAWPRPLLLAAVALSGFVSIGYELIWMRSIVFLLGSDTFAFAGVLTIYLLGNMTGALIASRLAPRLRNPAAGLGLTLGCLGVLGIAYVPWFSAWHGALAQQVLPLIGPLLASQSVSTPAWYLFQCAALFLLPAMMMGAGFPFALQASSSTHAHVGHTTGMLYGLNTFGAVVGGIFTGFVLIPVAGAQLSITLLGLGCLWPGLLLLRAHAKHPTYRWRVLAAGGALTAATALIPANLFESRLAAFPGTSLLAVQHGVNTTVTAYEPAGSHLGEVLLASSGVIVAGDERGIRSAQKMLGHLGALLHSSARRVLTVGFGSGETSASLATHDAERIDCVEIAPELVQVALRFFRHLNLGDRLHETVNMIYMDARNYLHLTDRQYDLIINDADRPSAPGSAALFTREHFVRVKDRMSPGGLFVTKLHTDIPRASFDSILGTFLDVYPHTTIWFPATKPYMFFYLVGSREPQMFSPVHVASQLQLDAVRTSASYLNVATAADVLGWYIGDERDVRRYLKAFQVNTDDRPFVEFNTELRASDPRALIKQFIEIVRRDSIVNHIDWTGMPDAEHGAWQAERQRAYAASTRMLQAYAEDTIMLTLDTIGMGLDAMPGNAGLLDQEDLSLVGVRARLEGADTNAEAVVAEMDAVLRQEPRFGAAWLIKSWASQKMMRFDQALTAGERALDHAPYTAAAHANMGALQSRLGRFDAAIEHYVKAVQLRPLDARLRVDLGVALRQRGRLREAAAEYREALRTYPRYRRAQDELSATHASD